MFWNLLYTAVYVETLSSTTESRDGYSEGEMTESTTEGSFELDFQPPFVPILITGLLTFAVGLITVLFVLQLVVTCLRRYLSGRRDLELLKNAELKEEDSVGRMGNSGVKLFSTEIEQFGIFPSTFTSTDVTASTSNLIRDGFNKKSTVETFQTKGRLLRLPTLRRSQSKSLSAFMIEKEQSDDSSD
jgi:hypothetical protein